MAGSEVMRAKSRLGVACRRKDGPAVAEARRELAVAKIVAFIGRATHDAPPLRPEDVRRIIQALG